MSETAIGQRELIAALHLEDLFNSAQLGFAEPLMSRAAVPPHAGNAKTPACCTA